MFESNIELPKFLKLLMTFIDRVGFPILAFILMFYMSNVSIQKVTCAINDNTKALTEFSTRSTEVQKSILHNQSTILSDLKSIMLKNSYKPQ